MPDEKDLERRITFLEQVLWHLFEIKPTEKISKAYLLELRNSIRTSGKWRAQEIADRFNDTARAQHESVRELARTLTNMSQQIAKGLDRIGEPSVAREPMVSALMSLEGSLEQVTLRIANVEREVRDVERSTGVNTETAHAYFLALGLGLDLTDIPLRRFLPVRVYLQEFSSPDFRFGCGTFAHSISRQALIVAGFSRETRPRRVTPSG